MTAPSQRALRSLVDLLDDEDPGSLALVRKQILGVGKAMLPLLEEAHGRLGPRLRDRLDALISELRLRDLESEFRSLAAEPEPDLERGAFLISRLGYPLLDPARYSEWMDGVAADAAEAARGQRGYPLLHQLHLQLFERLGFRGDQESYYDPDNSYLHRVIESRKGIPVSLSVLLLLLGRRLQLPLAGAGLPGHFMVRAELGRGPFFVDPFHRGRLLSPRQCRDLLLRAGYPFREEFLLPCGSRDILARMMRNLLSLHQRGGRPEAAERLSRLVEILLTGGVQSQRHL